MTQPKLVVHVGQKKTGSTALQLALKRSQAMLSQNGVLYPTVPGWFNHNWLVAYLGGVEAVPRFHRLQCGDSAEKAVEESERAWSNIRRQINSQQPQTVVLSSEFLLDFGQMGLTERLLQAGHEISSDITIVGYLREPAAHLLSLKQEELKRGEPTLKLAPRQHFRTALEPLLEAPDVKVSMREFARDRLEGQNIVRDFAEHFLPPHARPHLANLPNDMNSSVSAEMMAIFEAIQTRSGPVPLTAHPGVYHELTLFLIHLDQNTPGRQRPRFKPGVARAIHDLSQDLDWLDQHLGIRFEPPAPAKDGKTPEISTIQTVRDLCLVDEARYAKLVAAIPGPRAVQRHLKYRKALGWIKRTPQRFRRNLRRILGPLGRRLST